MLLNFGIFLFSFVEFPNGLEKVSSQNKASGVSSENAV
jgi:hypothetical protein